jgi:hypothetical protein
MTTKLLKIFLLFVFGIVHSQNNHVIETSDIDNFWNAYDKLKDAKSINDSINIMQTDYIDKSSQYFKEFIRVRNFKAEEYIKLLRKYPKFWISIRKETENVKYRKGEIIKILDKYEQEIPNFKRPNVCFGIGCLRTGGTVSNNLILIGTEIAASTRETEKSELSPWLKSVIGTNGDIVEMVSHETIHTQQKGGYLRDLVEHSISEGVADFLSEKISGIKINKVSYKYGFANDSELRKEFLNDYSINKNDISKWLYNGNNSEQKPADLGYYIGYRIAEEFYNKTIDKEKAILHLLNRKRYLKIFKNSNYIKNGIKIYEKE